MLSRKAAELFRWRTRADVGHKELFEGEGRKNHYVKPEANYCRLNSRRQRPPRTGNDKR